MTFVIAMYSGILVSVRGKRGTTVFATFHRSQSWGNKSNNKVQAITKTSGQICAGVLPLFLHSTTLTLHVPLPFSAHSPSPACIPQRSTEVSRAHIA